MKKIFSLFAAVLMAVSVMAAWPAALPDDGVDFANYAGWTTNVKTRNVAIYDDNEYLMAYSSGNDLAIEANGLKVGSSNYGACFFFYLDDEATVSIDVYRNGTSETVYLYSCGTTKPSAPTSSTYNVNTDFTSIGSVALGSNNGVKKTISLSSTLSKGYYKVFCPKRFYLKAINVEYSGSDTRTAVNISTFTATNTTLTLGTLESTTTEVTNDQATWTASYTYESDNEEVAKVNKDGVITAIADGTAKIKVSLNIPSNDETWKKGTISSKIVEITVIDPSKLTAIFALETNPYEWEATSDNATYYDGTTYAPATEGAITLTQEGKVRMWLSGSKHSLRLYDKDDDYSVGAINLAGATITSIKLEGTNMTFTSEVGSISVASDKSYCIWKGNETSVKLTKGNNTPQIKTITVTYIAKTYEVTFSNNWASFCAAEKVALPAGVVAYKGAVNGEKLTLTPVDGNVLPAGVGVMLKSNETSATLTESTEEAATIEGNQLWGTTEVTDAPANAYCYSKSQNAFAPVAEGFKIPANKAYLVLGAGAPSRISIVENVATSVENNALNVEVKKVIVNGQMMIIRGGNMFDLNGHLVK